MYERKKKPSLEQVRTLFPFDPVVLAQEADVHFMTVYHALSQRPIALSDAEKILKALSTYTGLSLTLEKVEIVLRDQFDMLWAVRASTDAQAEASEEVENRYLFLYARDRDEAAILAAEDLARWPHLPHHFFCPCPAGLRMGDFVMPGLQKVATGI